MLMLREKGKGTENCKNLIFVKRRKIQKLTQKIYKKN
jgi:hypothetical protein